VQEWLFTFPFPPIPISVDYSHSHPIPIDLFPFPCSGPKHYAITSNFCLKKQVCWKLQFQSLMLFVHVLIYSLQFLHITVQKEQAVSRVRAEVGSPLFEQAAGGAEDPLAGRRWGWHTQDAAGDFEELWQHGTIFFPEAHRVNVLSHLHVHIVGQFTSLVPHVLRITMIAEVVQSCSLCLWFLSQSKQQHT